MSKVASLRNFPSWAGPMNPIRCTIVDRRGAVSFVAHADALPSLVAACTANPSGLDGLLALSEPYYRGLREYVETGLAVFDEMNVRGLAPDALAWRPSPREWTMKEIARHLGDVEMVYGVRFRAMLAEEDPLLLTLDQERWAAGLGYVKDNLADALDLFAALRRWNVLIVKRAGPKNWERGGRHARDG